MAPAPASVALHDVGPLYEVVADTRLHDAALAGQVAQFENILREMGGGNSLLDRRDRAGDTPLHLASLGGHLRLVARLLEECPRLVDAQDNQGWTALHYASSTGNTGVATALLDAGARIIQNKDGNTPAHEAATKGHAGCGQLIVERAAAKAATGRATGRDFDLAAVVGALNAAGETALMLAAARGTPPTVVALLEHGAPLELRSHAGWTCLIHAANAGRTAVVSLLCQRGAALDARDRMGETALHKACAKEIPACVRTLVDAGADVRRLNRDGRSPLHLCAYNRNEQCARAVLDAAGYSGWVRALVVARDREGMTALDLATKLANKRLAVLLRQTVGAMIVQSCFRNYIGRIHAEQTACAIKIQRVFRGRSTRVIYQQHSKAREIRLNHAARVIQRRYRKWAGRRRRRDTYGLTARVQTDFAADIVETEAKLHDGNQARLDAARTREERIMDGQERQQLALKREAEGLLAADASQAGSSDATGEGAGGNTTSTAPPPLPLHAVADSIRDVAPEGEHIRYEERDSMKMEGVPGGPRPPVIDVGAVIIALQQLEKHTIARFDKLGTAVAMMRARVAELESQLVEEMSHDAVALAQVQEARADEGFFSNRASRFPHPAPTPSASASLRSAPFAQLLPVVCLWQQCGTWHRRCLR